MSDPFGLLGIMVRCLTTHLKEARPGRDTCQKLAKIFLLTGLSLGTSQGKPKILKSPTQKRVSTKAQLQLAIDATSTQDLGAG